MKVQEIRAIAKQMGVGTAKMGKTEIIRLIQKAEDNPECFGCGGAETCPQMDCLWMKDCLTT